MVALVGETNSGKSTLINALVQDKVSIVSHKVQTTRNRILAILTEGEKQIVFIDTPGLFKAKTAKDSVMLRFAYGSLAEASVVAVMVDCVKGITPVLEQLLERLKTLSHPNVVLVLNKVDLLLKTNRERLLELSKQMYSKGLFKEIFMLSALKGYEVERFQEYLLENLNQEGWLFNEDEVSNVSKQFWATEITREQIYRFVHKEVPYCLAVKPMLWDEGKKDIIIKQDIVVSRASHKKILVGNNAEGIKRICLAAKAELARQLDKNIHLYLFVKINDRALKREEYFNNLDCLQSKPS